MYVQFQSEYARRLERQIVLADTKVCSAMLTLLQQEVSGYVRGGWMMRKAWRIYQHTYLQILQLYRRTFGTNPTGSLFYLIYNFSQYSDFSYLMFEIVGLINYAALLDFQIIDVSCFNPARMIRVISTRANAPFSESASRKLVAGRIKHEFIFQG